MSVQICIEMFTYITTKDKQKTPLQLLIPPLLSAPREIPFWILRRQFSSVHSGFFESMPFMIFLSCQEIISVSRQLTPKILGCNQCPSTLLKSTKNVTFLSKITSSFPYPVLQKMNELTGYKLNNYFFSECRVIRILIAQTCIQARFLPKDWYKLWKVIYNILYIKTSAKGHVRKHVRHTKNKS